MPPKLIFRRPFPGRPTPGSKAGFEGERDVPVAPPAVLVVGGKSAQVRQSSSGLALLEIKAMANTHGVLWEGHGQCHVGQAQRTRRGGQEQRPREMV